MLTLQDTELTRYICSNSICHERVHSNRHDPALVVPFPVLLLGPQPDQVRPPQAFLRNQPLPIQLRPGAEA